MEAEMACDMLKKRKSLINTDDDKECIPSLRGVIKMW
jgi:hypothetical protein